MKILFLVTKLYNGGAERQMREVIELGIKRGHNIEVIDLETIENLSEEYNVIQLKKENFFSERNKIKQIFKRMYVYITIYKKLKTRNDDYVVFFGFDFLPIVYLSNKKFIYSIREYNLKYFKKLDVFFKKLYLITTNNIPSYIELRKKYTNIFLQNNYINSKNIEESLFDVKEKNYLVVSSINKHKNILPIIKVFKKLERKGYKLKIAGKISDITYYKILTDEMGEAKNIEFLENLEYKELKKEYLKAEGVIHLSKQEGTPNALLDAIKFKKKFICLSTPENICLFAETPIFMINTEEELEKKIYELEKIDYSTEMKFLFEKIKIMFLEKNIEEFYKILEINIKER